MPDVPMHIALDHAAVVTSRLPEAVAFYVDVIGLALRVMEDDPLREGRRRALLTDAGGRDVLELIEMEELCHPAVPGRGGMHHLGFRLSRDAWHALRARLDAKRVAYQEIQQRLFVRDADGLVLEIEQA